MKPGFDFDRPHPGWPHDFHAWHHGSYHWIDMPWWIAGPLLLAGMAAYFLPTLVAYWRGHHNRVAIAVLNVFLGWTFFGWVVALVWAATVLKRPPSGGP